MSSKCYPKEFKIGAVKQITERRHPVAEISARLGVSQHSLYEWVRKYSQPDPVRREAQNKDAELRRLQAELKRVTEERNILKLVASQSRRGNCHDNAVAESFFQLLKRERMRRRIYLDREEARRD
ncbi:conserved hypothetical protein, partial [Ricinus communis]